MEKYKLEDFDLVVVVYDNKLFNFHGLTNEGCCVLSLPDKNAKSFKKPMNKVIIKTLQFIVSKYNTWDNMNFDNIQDVECGVYVDPDEKIENQYGLTNRETTILNKLSDVWNLFVELEVQYPMDRDEFNKAIHNVQHIIMKREAIRNNPILFQNIGEDYEK